jgi:AAA domain-containing protein
MSEVARYTFTSGSRAEGAISYGDKLHSHHDSDVASGQNNAFDLVRLHRFGHLDATSPKGTPVTELPSYKAMVSFAMSLPEVTAEMDDPAAEFEDLGPLTEDEQMPADHVKGGEALAKRICDVLRTPTKPRWLYTDCIERGVIALMVGPRGSYKSFIALDWSARIAMAIPKGSDEAVYVISAEGGDYDRRFKAWWMTFGDGRPLEDLPFYVVEKRLNLSNKDGIEILRADAKRIGKKPVLWVWDTWSKLTGGTDENSNTEVKQVIGLIDNGLKRPYDSTVLVVCHVGHSDSGRVRGASALGADSDSEYIIARDERSGTVSLTRERFKSSPELEPLCYKPESVELGYADDQGRQVTSLILRPVAAEEAGHARGPTGANQKLVWRTLQTLSPDGRPVAVVGLLEQVASGQAAPPAGVRDRREETARRALNQLVEAGFAHLLAHGTQVTLTKAAAVADDEFEGEDK